MKTLIRLKASLTNGLCAVCGQPAIEQFNVHFRRARDFVPAGFTCKRDDCYDTVEATRDSDGHLPTEQLT